MTAFGQRVTPQRVFLKGTARISSCSIGVSMRMGIVEGSEWKIGESLPTEFMVNGLASRLSDGKGTFRKIRGCGRQGNIDEM